MARHYYLTRAGRLRRKDRTLWFEPKENGSMAETTAAEQVGGEDIQFDSAIDSLPVEIEDVPFFGASEDEMGTLEFEPELLDFAPHEEENKAEDERPLRVADRRVIPVEDVDAIWIFGEVDLNSRALNFLAQHRIPVHFFNYYGYYTGTFYPREHLQAGYVLVRQVRHYGNRRLRLELAREFVNASLYNVLRNLRYYGTRGVETAAQTEAVQSEILKLPTVKRIDELMGCEGRARAAYYSTFAKILRAADADVDLTKRTRRPPDNLINALLSFANGLVYSAVLTQIYRSQLDPTISFLHEPGFRRFSLALDLAEVFKPVLADRLIFKLLNTRQLAEKHFAQDLNCCYLKESGRKIVLEAWNARLATTIEHRRLKRHVSYERLIRLECYKLVKHLTGDEPYKGFKAWW